MIRARIDWSQGERSKSMVFEAGWDCIRRAAFYFFERCQDAINVPNPGQQRTRRRDTIAGKKGSTYTVYPSPSRPGEPPRKRTGFGAANVGIEYDQSALTAYVGVGQSAPYMAIMEVTRNRRRNRPWLLATLRKYWDQISQMAKPA